MYSFFVEMPKGITITKIYGEMLEKRDKEKNNTESVERKISKLIEEEVLKGIEAGYDYGLEEGIHEGEIRGRLKTGMEMLAMNVNIQTIMEACNFTEEQIEMLKQKDN